MISTGIAYLDKLTGGLRLGDNVVWQVADGVSIDVFIESFFEHNQSFRKNIIYINSNYSPHTIKKRYNFLFDKNTTLFDAFTHGKGNSDEVFLDFYREEDIDPDHYICMKNPRDISSFIAILNEVEKTNRDGSFYIFDSLTGLLELWKNERDVVDFFAFKCPKLYDMNTLAYWIYERDAHSREFIASISHITHNASHQDYYRLNINKLENKPSFHTVDSHYFRIIGREIRFITEKTEEMIRVGEKVKQLRKGKGLTQSGLALALGMTAGAVSQIENNITSPSLQTLVHMAAFFDRPPGYFIGTDGEDNRQKGYVLARKSGKGIKKQNNALAEELARDPRDRVRAYAVIIAARSSIEGPILLHKGAEFIAVTSGTVEMVINDKKTLLHEGDSLFIDSSFVTRWKTDEEECRLVHLLLG